jgi:hypothetical protein
MDYKQTYNWVTAHQLVFLLVSANTIVTGNNHIYKGYQVVPPVLSYIE